MVHDIVEEIPSKSYDLVICRQCLNHMTLADALRAVQNIHASGSTFLLATSYSRSGDNSLFQGREGGISYRPFNLARPPFDKVLTQAAVAEYEDEYDEEARKTNPMILALWKFA